jgi:hypothetical protein
MALNTRERKREYSKCQGSAFCELGLRPLGVRIVVLESLIELILKVQRSVESRDMKGLYCDEARKV